jgi:hypothetical protein
VTVAYLAPEPLGAGHDVDAFTCRSTEQTTWLQRHARQAAAIGTAKTFVVTEPDRSQVVAYYAWSMAQLALEATPARLSKGAGRYPQPVALLARLGVDVGHEGRGLGGGLLLDVSTRFVELAEVIGCRGLLIHAEDETARASYLHLVPELQTSPTDPLHLVLRAKDARRTLLDPP